MENENKEILENEEVTEEQHEVEIKEEVPETEVEEEYVGKEVTTSIRYDYRTMKFYNMYNAAVRRKIPLIYFIFGLLTIAGAIYMLISSYFEVQKDPEASMTSTYFIVVIFAFFCFYFIKQSVTFEKFVDKQITNHFNVHKVAKQNIRIREDKITLIPVNKPEESFSYDWVQVTSIEEIDEFFFLYIGKSPLIIDKNPEMMVEGTYEQMLEIFAEKIEVKPYKRYDKKVVKTPITYVHQDDLEEDEESIEVETVDNEEEPNDQN